MFAAGAFPGPHWEAQDQVDWEGKASILAPAIVTRRRRLYPLSPQPPLLITPNNPGFATDRLMPEPVNEDRRLMQPRNRQTAHAERRAYNVHMKQRN